MFKSRGNVYLLETRIVKIEQRSLLFARLTFSVKMNAEDYLCVYIYIGTDKLQRLKGHRKSCFVINID